MIFSALSLHCLRGTATGKWEELSKGVEGLFYYCLEEREK